MINSRNLIYTNILDLTVKTMKKTGNGSSMGMMLIGLVTLLLSLGLVVISRFTI